MRRKPRLVILECTSESREKMSEGMLLRELMRILGFGNRTRLSSIKNKDSFLRKLEAIQEPYLHISAHGDFAPARGIRIDLPHKAKIYSSDLVGLWKNKARSRIPRLVVLSACETGHVDMVSAFSDAGCQYCIAPLHETLWEDAAVFSTLLYKLLIGERMSPWVSFKKTTIGISNVLPRLSGAWSFYEWGEKVTIDEL
jgi:hypothetical protein